jgi:hypothetical protein
MDIFRYHTNSGTPPEPSHFSNNGEVDVVMKNHFTHIKVYEDSSDGEIVYEPAQANQHCFRYYIQLIVHMQQFNYLYFV